jgi:hypothetical protein
MESLCWYDTQTKLEYTLYSLSFSLRKPDVDKLFIGL